MLKNQSGSRDRMELQVAEIASSEACRGAEFADALRAWLFMEQREFSICVGRSQCRTEGRLILNQGCPNLFLTKGHNTYCELVQEPNV
jgi:hypothetical protein